MATDQLAFHNTLNPKMLFVQLQEGLILTPKGAVLKEADIRHGLQGGLSQTAEKFQAAQLSPLQGEAWSRFQRGFATGGTWTGVAGATFVAGQAYDAADVVKQLQTDKFWHKSFFSAKGELRCCRFFTDFNPSLATNAEAYLSGDEYRERWLAKWQAIGSLPVFSGKSTGGKWTYIGLCAVKSVETSAAALELARSMIKGVPEWQVGAVLNLAKGE